MEESGRAQAKAGGGGGVSSRKGKRAAGGGGGLGDGQRGKQRKGMGSGGGSRREGRDGDVGWGVGKEGRGGELPGAYNRGLKKSYATSWLLLVLIVIVWVFLVFVTAGPKLGDGPRWNLRGAVEGKKRVEKEDVERELGLIKKMLMFLREEENNDL